MSIFKKIIFSVFPNPALILIKEWHFYKKIKKAKITEEDDLVMIKNIIKPGDHVLDIGANVGLYTRFLSEMVGRKGKVLSIEPIPETYRYLKNNVQKLNLANVNSLNIAASSNPGTATMQIPRFSDNRPNLYEAAITHTPNARITSIEVNTDTVDNICSRHHIEPAFIKCDVEGHEWEVFQGAANVLTKYKPLLLIEINCNLLNPDSNAAQLISYLLETGYTTYINNGNMLQKRDSEQKVNYYFLTSNHVQSLQEIIKH
jgi:FkbM family methyltransferase